MKKIEIIKTIGGIMVSVGVSSIIGTAIKSTNPTESAGAIKKLCIGLGGIVLSSMVSDKAVTYTETKIDTVVEEAKKIVDEIEELE